MSEEIKPGIYRHYKGHEYRYIGMGRHSETLEDLVIYQDMEKPELFWARPAEMFLEEVEVEGKITPRFLWIRGE
jgi:hypothetical protein